MTSSTIATTTQTSQAPTLPTTIPSEVIQHLPSFGSLFRFDDRLRSLEQNFSKVMQTNQFAGAVSAILGIVQYYMDQWMNEAVQVKEQVKAQVSKILPKIEQAVNEQLEAEVLTRSSHSSRTSYAIVAYLSEMELKKILIEKMEGNKSIQRSDEQRNLYKALVDAFDFDKIILDTYRKTVTLNRRRDDDEDKDEEPSTGPDRGSKRSREEEPVQTTSQMEEPSHSEFEIGADDQPIVQSSQHPEWFSQPKKPPSPDRDWNETLPAVHRSIQLWISELAKQADTHSSFNELMDTPLDFSNFIMNQLRVDTLILELLAGPTYDLMKGSCKSLIELEYHLEEVYKATTDQLDWVNPEGQQYPHNLLQPLPLIPDNRGHRVIPFAHFINNNLEYLRGDLPNFGSPFGFDHRLKTLEANFSEFTQTNQFARVVSSIPRIVHRYMDQRINEAVKVAVQLQSDRLRDEAQKENDEFLKTIDENMKKIIKEQVKEQVKVQVSKILLKIEQTVNEKLEAEVLTRNLYKALVKAYESDKIILDTYGDTVTLKRHRDDDADKDEEPSTGSDRGSKRRREGKEPELANAQKEKATRSAGKSTQGSKSRQTSASESATAKEPMQTTFKMEEPSHPEARILLEEVYKATTYQLDWVNPEGQQYPYNMLKPLPLILNSRSHRFIPFDHFINNDLEYLRGGALSRKYTTSVTKTKAADYGHIKWIKDLVPRTMWIQEPIGYDKHAFWGITYWGSKLQQFYGFAVNRESARDVYSKRRIIAVTKLKIIEWHNYKHLDWITVHKDDDKLYKFKEGDFKRPRIQDIEDMLLLLVQGKLTNLTVEERFAFNISLRMFTRSIVIQRRMEDLQLGVESYQKKLNLTRLDFDGTLIDVRTALDGPLKVMRMKYPPQTIWRKSDKERAAAMIQAIDKSLRTRRIMRSLERSLLTDLQVTPTKIRRMTKPYSSYYFIANCFNAENLKMEVKCMSTHSTSSNLFYSLRVPESLIRQKNLGEPSSLFDFEEVMSIPHNNQGPPPAGPPPPNNNGLPMVQNGISDDALRLSLFPYSLTHTATAWYDRLQRNSIHTFDDTMRKFFSKYIPPSMVTKLRNKIMKFRQDPNESLFQAWERYKLSFDRETFTIRWRAITTNANLPEILFEQDLEAETVGNLHGFAQLRKNPSFLQMQSPSGSISLPSNTISNPIGDLKSITTESGVAYDGPTIPPTSSHIPKEVERKTKATKDNVQTTSSESTAHVQPLVVQDPSPEPDVAPKPNHKP
nr:reverse transcriptase domain-containing protein [Tanacetum cinerariifolium]